MPLLTLERFAQLWHLLFVGLARIAQTHASHRTWPYISRFADKSIVCASHVQK